MKIICLTGGFASGKSTAAKFMEEQGASIIDADRLGHRAYDVGTQAYRQVIDTFGPEIVADDNEIDREVLGNMVFGKPEELTRLTDIVWPEIRRLAGLEIAGFDAIYPDGIVVLEAAVLFEAGWQDMGEETWVVVVHREIAIDRSIMRNKITREAAEKRIDSQITNEERISKADVVIENNSDQPALLAKLEKEWARITS